MSEKLRVKCVHPQIYRPKNMCVHARACTLEINLLDIKYPARVFLNFIIVEIKNYNLEPELSNKNNKIETTR